MPESQTAVRNIKPKTLIIIGLVGVFFSLCIVAYGVDSLPSCPSLKAEQVTASRTDARIEACHKLGGDYVADHVFAPRCLIEATGVKFISPEELDATPN